MELGEEDYRDEGLFASHYMYISRDHTVNMIMTVDFDPDYLAEIIC